MLYKRSNKPGSHWWVRFEVKGIYVRQSSGTDRKDRAQAFEKELRDAIWDEENLGIETHTWDEAIARWMREKAHKRSLARDTQAFAALGLRGELTAELVAGYSECGARERAAYRSILNQCVRWGWFGKAPKVEMPHEEKHEPRWITQEAFERLCKELPPHAVQLARFAVNTGLRQRNIYQLKWANVDLARKSVRVGSADAKSGKANSFPLSPNALAVLREQRGKHETFVFTDDKGRAPIGSIKTTWGKAVDRAGHRGLRFHDLRHTWAAWHTLKGTPPIILKELGGWSSLAMVERYGHLNPGHLADWADNSSTKSGTRGKRKRGKSLKK